MKTINRNPMSVKQLDYNDVNYKFFNHANWKGMCEDKNYMGVDQETFAECDNVYIDEDFILKSRPSIKKATDDLLYSGGIIENVKCINNYIFIGWIDPSGPENRLLIYKYTNKYTLIIDKLLLTTAQTKNITYLTKNNKIYLFGITSNVIFIFDIKTETLTQDNIGTSLYSPIKEVYINGKLLSEDAEQDNEFYSGYKKSFKWLYSSESSYEIDNFVNDYIRLGKNSADTKITINDDTEVIGQLDETTSKKLVAAGIKLNEDNFAFFETSNTLTKTRTNIPLIEYDKTHNILIISSAKFVANQKGATYNIQYSFNGKIFNSLPAIENCYGVPFLSQDGTTLYIIKHGTNRTNFPQIHSISILPNEYGNFDYTDWTNRMTGTLPHNFTSYENGVVKGFALDRDVFAIMLNHDQILWHKKDGWENILTAYTYTDSDTQPSTYAVKFVSKLFGSTKSSIGTSTFTLFAVSNDYSNNFVLCAYGNDFYNEAINSDLKSRMSVISTTNYSAEDIYNLNDFVDTPIANIALVIDDNIKTYSLSKLSISGVSPVILFNNFRMDINLLSNTKIIKIDSLNNIGLKILFATNSALYYKTNTEVILLTNYTTNIYPINSTKITYVKDNTVYSQDYINNLEIIDEYDGTIIIPTINDIAELNNYYVSSENTLYISSTGAYDEDNELWYFPKINTQKFDFDISNLHPISSTEVAIFLEESIYYVSYDSNIKGYRYYKSRIELGCRKGADIITTYDNKYTIFTTKRGVVAMSYQDFINSTEQALTYLSDNIFEHFNNWNTTAVKLQLYKFWIICYRTTGTNTNKAFIYDLRNSSWWPVSFKIDALTQFAEMPDKLRILKDRFYDLDTSDYEYYDVFGKDKNIDWYIKSQKLHFNAINYYKHIVNITLFAVSDNQTDIVMNLKVRNYRKIADYGKNLSNSKRIEDALTYKVDMTRTFVKRLNYYKLNEFEYTLTNYSEETNNKILDLVPLSLTSISIKYLITGQVR
nr:MAG TPA: hypothetical protein [Caudoviricetes sp.]